MRQSGDGERLERHTSGESADGADAAVPSEHLGMPATGEEQADVPASEAQGVSVDKDPPLGQSGVTSGVSSQFELDLLTLQLNKRELVERLILEEAMMSSLGRCFIFLAQFMVFLSMLGYAYPCTSMYETHRVITDSLCLDDLDMCPSDVRDITSLKSYLVGLAQEAKAASPGSSSYAADPLARAYISTELLPNSEKVVPGAMQPMLTSDFTFTVWINTQVRFDDIVKKKTSDDIAPQLCWSISLEYVRYGEHESVEPQEVMNPKVSDMIVDGISWDKSWLRQNVEDGHWNHYAVLVNATHIEFAHNGVKGTPVPIQRPLSDCANGIMTIGSRSSAGKLMSLKYFPRILSDAELKDVRSSGKLLEDILSSSGAEAGSVDPLDELRQEANDLFAESKSLAARNHKELSLNQRRMANYVANSQERRLGVVAGLDAKAMNFEAPRKTEQEPSRDTLRSPATAMAGHAGCAPWAPSLCGPPKTPEPRQQKLEQADDTSPKHRHKAGLKSSPPLSTKIQGKPAPSATTGVGNMSGRWRRHFFGAKNPSLKTSRPSSRRRKSDKVNQRSHAKDIEVSRRLTDSYIPTDDMDQLLWFEMMGCEDAAFCSPYLVGQALNIVRYEGFAKGFLFDLKFGQIRVDNWDDYEDWIALLDCMIQKVQPSDTDVEAQPAYLNAVNVRPWANASKLFPEDGTCGSPADFQADHLAIVQTALYVALVHTTTNTACLDATSTFASSCKYTCGSCFMDYVSPKETASFLGSCQDDPAYVDHVGQTCRWYSENDQPSCSTYADSATREACALTCGTCDRNGGLFDVMDILPEDGGWNHIEWNMLIQPFEGEQYQRVNVHGVYNFMIHETCMSLFGDFGQLDPMENEACMAQRLFLSKQYALKVQGLSDAIDDLDAYLRATQQAFSSFAGYGFKEEAWAVRFPEPAVLAGTANRALQMEWAHPHFKTCSSQSDCQGMMVWACGDLRPENVICKRKYQIPAFCATSCHTGGCGDRADIRQGTSGSFCQPCDACALEAISCPDWCADYQVDKDGYFPKFYEWLLFGRRWDEPYEAPSPIWNEGSFALMVWIKDFTFQYIFQKSIVMPGLDASWEDYDTESSQLVCWKMDLDGIKYRSRWDDKTLTTLKNPAADVIKATPSQWHHLIVDKATETSNGGNLVEFKFYVDGVEAVEAESLFSISAVPPFGFPDCGGQIRNSFAAAYEWYEGPRVDHQPPYTWNVPTDRLQPLTKDGVTVLGFGDVTIPPNAYIKEAHLEICAMEDYFGFLMRQPGMSGGSNTCNEAGYSLSRRDKITYKIAGLIHAGNMREPAEHGECFVTEVINSPDNDTVTGTKLTGNQSIWEVDARSWRANGVPQVDEDSMLEKHEKRHCVQVSTDISKVILEIVGRSDWEYGNEITLVMAEENKPWEECTVSNMFVNQSLEAELAPEMWELGATLGNYCPLIEMYAGLHADGLPLWMMPVSYDTSPYFKPNKLVVNYCLNEECVSPAFLGSGPDAEYGTMTNWGANRRLQEKKPKARRQPAKRESQKQASGGAARETRSNAKAAPRTNAKAAPRAGQTKEQQLLGGVSKERKLSVPDRATHRETSVAEPPANASHEARRLVFKASDCPTTGTCMRLGVPISPGVPLDGLMYDAKLVPRSLALSEVQTEYYSGLQRVSSITGPKTPVSAKDLQLQLAAYPSEVVSVIPPIVLQERSEIAPCKNLMGDLASPLLTYFRKQVQAKCSTIYECQYPESSEGGSGFVCVDRNKQISESARWFNRSSVKFKGDVVFPEFVDLFTSPQVYIEDSNDIVESTDWLNLQTKKVVLLLVYMNPSKRMGTLVQISWDYRNSGGGRLQASDELMSYIAMSPTEQETWETLLKLIFVFNIVDILIVVATILLRLRFRIQTLAVVEHTTWHVQEKFKKVLPIWEPMDIIDVGLRVWMTFFAAMHWLNYGGHFEDKMREILTLQWDNREFSYAQKFNDFIQRVIDFQVILEADAQHRLHAYILILVLFLRLIIYMKIHPRVAILYKTWVVMKDDFVHFLVLFMMIYMTLAFAAAWSFGDQIPGFSGFFEAIVTQFILLTLDFTSIAYPDPEVKPELSLQFGIYCLLYFFIVASLLLNFFLAIVVDSYADVKKEIQRCDVENSVIWDIYTTVKYPVVRIFRRWPSRGCFLTNLLTANLGRASRGKNDEILEMVYVNSQVLYEKGVITHSREMACSILRHYKSVCPRTQIVPGGHDADIEYTGDAAPEHKRLQLQMIRLDDLLHQDREHAKGTQGSMEPAPEDPIKELSNVVAAQGNDLERMSNTLSTKVEELAALQARQQEVEEERQKQLVALQDMQSKLQDEHRAMAQRRTEREQQLEHPALPQQAQTEQQSSQPSDATPGWAERASNELVAKMRSELMSDWDKFRQDVSAKSSESLQALRAEGDQLEALQKQVEKALEQLSKAEARAAETPSTQAANPVSALPPSTSEESMSPLSPSAPTSSAPTPQVAFRKREEGPRRPSNPDTSRGQSNPVSSSSQKSYGNPILQQFSIRSGRSDSVGV